MIESNNTKTINGHEYIVGHLPAMQNYSLFLRLSAICGDSLSELSATFLGDAKSYEGLGEAANKLLSSIYVNDPNGKLLLDILSQTQRDGDPVSDKSFNRFYMGNMGEMIEALLYSCEVHFKHFFPSSLLSGLQEKLAEVAKTETPAENLTGN